jgi:Polyketide cyclase / dehydrase and lipid transport
VRRFRAAADVGAQPPAVFAFLADLRNHWRLTGPRVRLVELDGSHGGTVVIQGPLGVHRTAGTSVRETNPPRMMQGEAQIGTRTRVVVRWTITSVGSTSSRVVLEASVESCGFLDRALLALGGHLWMQRLFDRTVARLAEVIEAGETDEAAPSRSAGRVRAVAAW